MIWTFIFFTQLHNCCDESLMGLFCGLYTEGDPRHEIGGKGQPSGVLLGSKSAWLQSQSSLLA